MLLEEQHCLDTNATSVGTQGVKSCKKLLLGKLTPTHLGPLAEAAMASLGKRFEETNHHPSTTMLTALSEVAVIMQGMANGTCPPSIFLSALDPGVGKTQTIVHFVQALLRSESHSDVGVLLCVSRLAEIGSLVATMGLSKDQFGVFTSDKELNALGVAPNEARVLFTTHSMVECRTEGRQFSEVWELAWNGRPRQVRVWDEAILPGRKLTLGRDDIASLFKPLRSVHPSLTEELDDLCSRLRSTEDGTALQLDDFAATHGVDLNDVLGLIQNCPEAQKSAAENLWHLSGKMVTVRKDGKFGQTILDYRDTLPEDLAPLLVLDASGRVRTVYRHWEERRGGLVSLSSAPKRYDNLTLHIWKTGGGKDAFRRNGTKLVDGIASTIMTKADQEWLVVHHKDKCGEDFAREVMNLVGSSTKVHFLNWGSHDATNQFAHVPNVILAGTLFYRTSYYEALGRLGAGQPSSDGAFAEVDHRDVEVGEHSHLILQALCRGSVRCCEGDVCAPCNAYIIASVRSGIPKALPVIFPGCRVETWKPVRRALKGKVRQAERYITGCFAANPDGVLAFATVAKAIGMDANNFRRSVRKHPDFIEALAEEDIVETTRGFVRETPDFVDETGDRSEAN